MPVALSLESKSNIVAYGTVIHANGDGKLLHGVPLPMNCMRISIDEVVENSARLPFPIPNECDTIGGAIGTHVAWPARWVVMKNEVNFLLSRAPHGEYLFNSSLGIFEDSFQHP